MHDIPILMLHTVNSQKTLNPLGELSVSPKGLEAYCKVFKKWKYQMISMQEFLENKYDKNRNFVILTFDDGYKDNLTVACSILKKYDAHATIFINPEYLSDESDPYSDWGFMTWDEVIEAENCGTFDIQAHTMTHEFTFISDSIIDYYTPEKFDKYYWLAWMLFPDSPRKWNGKAYSYRNKIPTGYPIFEYGRRIANRKFIPDPQYVTYLIEKYQNSYADEKQYNGSHGLYEDENHYNEYIIWEIVECKRIIEEKLKKKVTTLCFPGGGYDEYSLKLAQQSGYQCYMIASKMREGNNYEHLKNIEEGIFDGFNRTAFSLIHPGFLPDHLFDKWIAKLSLGAYQNMPLYVFLKKVLSKIWHT